MTIGSLDMERGRGLRIVGALFVVVCCLSRSRHQPFGSRVEVSTGTLKKHLILFVEGIDGGLEKMPQTVV